MKSSLMKRQIPIGRTVRKIRIFRTVRKYINRISTLFHFIDFSHRICYNNMKFNIHLENRC